MSEAIRGWRFSSTRPRKPEIFFVCLFLKSMYLPCEPGKSISWKKIARLAFNSSSPRNKQRQLQRDVPFYVQKQLIVLHPLRAWVFIPKER